MPSYGPYVEYGRAPSKTIVTIEGRQASESRDAAVQAREYLSTGAEVYLQVGGELCRVVGVTVEPPPRKD